MRAWFDSDRSRDTRSVTEWFRGSEELDPRNLDRWGRTQNAYQEERNSRTSGAFSRLFVGMFIAAAKIGLVVGTIVALAGWWNAHVSRLF